MATREGAVGAAPQRDGWTPARIFLAASAFYHLGLSLVGFAIDRSFPVGTTATEHAGSEHIFGIFETNGWHSLAAFLLGLVSLYFVLRPARAREVSLGVGISQALVVVAFALLPPETFWFASNAADQVIHSITAIGGITGSVLTQPARSRTSTFA